MSIPKQLRLAAPMDGDLPLCVDCTTIGTTVRGHSFSRTISLRIQRHRISDLVLRSILDAAREHFQTTSFLNGPTPIIDQSGGTITYTGYNVKDATGANNLGAPEPFPDPGRTVGTYYDSIVGSSGHTSFDFIAAARRQSKDNWNPAADGRGRQRLHSSGIWYNDL